MATRRRNRRAERRAENENRGAANALVEDSSDDEDQQVPPTPTLHTLRPHKLPKFSGDGDAEDFIREARAMLELQPMTDSVAAGWLLGAMEGRARQEILSMEARDYNSPGKFFNILVQQWGEQRDSATLAGAFHKRQQGLVESPGEYATALRILWAKTNAVEADTLAQVMLRNTFVNGLYPASLRRELKRFIRDRPESSFPDAVKEAQRWMREDGDADVAVQQTSAVDPGALQRLEAQVAALSSENTAIKQQLQDQRRPASVTSHRPPRQSGPRVQPIVQWPWGRNSNGPQRDLTCWWCQRQGHREADCPAKQAYQRRRAQPRQDVATSQQSRQNPGN
ncbi:hypothetical protein ACOMHN_057278 [Nucella lapillus]